MAAASGLPFETWVSRSLAACLFVPLFFPPVHGLFRAAVRPWVLYHAQRGVQRVEQLQALRRPFLISFCSWCCLTVSVEFYVTFLPFLFWVVSPQLAWRLTFLLAFAMFVGNAMKDLVCAPRPAAFMDEDGHPRVSAHQETSELTISAQEFGLPSSHTLNSCVMSFYIIYFLLERGLISTYTGRCLYVASSGWIAFIAFSRMYLGMHTPIDVLGGMLGGVAVLNFYITVDDELEAFLLSAQSPSGELLRILTLLLAAALVLRCHPKPVRNTPSFGDSSAFVAVTFGMSSGVSRIYGKHLFKGLIWGSVLASGGAWAVLKRLGLGFVLVAANQTVAKRVALTIVPPLYLFFPVRLRRLWQPPQHNLSEGELWRKHRIPLSDKNGMPWDVVDTAKFAAYASIGWTVAEAAPRLFAKLGS